MQLRSRELSLIERERDDYRRLVEGIRAQRPGPRRLGIELTCIGNAGGADNLVHGRPAGGLLMRGADRTLVIDPGDNTLAFLASLGFNPYEINDVLASHAHNDHVGDLAAMISAAVNLGLGQSADSHILASPALVDYTSGASTRFGFTLPAYAWRGEVHAVYWEPATIQRFDGVSLDAESRVALSDTMSVSAAEGRHGQVPVTGFVIDTPMGRIGYTSDTEYFPELAHGYRDVQVLWMNMNTLALDAIDDTAPAAATDRAEPVHNHLGYAGVCALIDEVRPETAVVSHLGAQLIDQRETIQDLLRERFADTGVQIHCPRSGDSLVFDPDLGATPRLQGFVP